MIAERSPDIPYMLTELRLAVVTWHDAHGPTTEWEDGLGTYEQVEVKTVGYITEHNDGVTLLQTIIPNQPASTFQRCGKFDIPNGCIRRIEWLEVIT